MVVVKIALLLVKNVFINVREGISELGRRVAAKYTTTLPTRYTFNSVIHFIQTDPFHLIYTMEIDTEKILRSTNVSKAAGIDDLLGRFLKYGSQVLSKPISELCNLFIILGSFSNSCKIAKLKHLLKKGTKLTSKYFFIKDLNFIQPSNHTSLINCLD